MNSLTTQVSSTNNVQCTVFSTVSYLVTLVHPCTEAEASFTVESRSDRIADILTAVKAERQARGLAGYEIFEYLPHV